MAKILIIDDTQDVSELLSIFLGKRGFQVFRAETGNKGISAFTEFKPDIVLLDMRLPDSGGIDVLKSIKQLDKLARVFMLSGLSSEDLEEEAALAGALGFLDKSRGIEEIVDRVSKEAKLWMRR
jgi:DNA-binding response OmpR family regulator